MIYVMKGVDEKDPSMPKFLLFILIVHKKVNKDYDYGSLDHSYKWKKFEEKNMEKLAFIPPSFSFLWYNLYD